MDRVRRMIATNSLAEIFTGLALHQFRAVRDAALSERGK